MFMSGASAFNLASDVPPRTTESYHVTYNPPITSKSILPANHVSSALDTLLSNVTRHEIVTGTSPHVPVYKESVYTPPAAPGDTGMSSHVFRTLQGNAGTTVIVDSFNDNNIIISSQVPTVDSIDYDTPPGASLSEPPGSSLDDFLDDVATNLRDVELESTTPPAPGPGESFASLNLASSINTTTTPHTKELNIRYLKSTNSRLSLSTASDEVILTSNVPSHLSFYFEDDANANPTDPDYGSTDGSGYTQGTATRWLAEVHGWTGTSPNYGQRLVRVPNFDVGGSPIDPAKVGFLVSARDGNLAENPPPPAIARVGRNPTSGFNFNVITYRWDSTNKEWDAVPMRFTIRFFLTDQPNS